MEFEKTESPNRESTTQPSDGASPSSSSVPLRRGRSRFRLALLAVPLLAAVGLGTAVRAQPDGGGGPGPGMMGDERGPGMHERMGKILTAVGATDAQKAQIKTIWQGARPQLKALHDEDEGLRKQIREAMAAPTVDSARIEQLRKQSVQTMDKLSTVMTQAFVSTANVLTPDQRKQVLAKFQEREEARKERHEGRHGGHHGPPAANAGAAGAGQ